MSSRRKRGKWSTVRPRNALTALLLLPPLLLGGCTGSDGISRRSSDSPPSPPDSIETTATPDPVVNGRIQSIYEYLDHVRPVCRHVRRSCYEVDFDPSARRLLVAWSRFGPKRLSVIGPGDRLVDLTCPDDLSCPTAYHPYAAALGPAADELSVWGAGYGVKDDEVQVLGRNGTVRRTIDLSASVGGRPVSVTDLAWSPDGTLLALATTEGPGGRGGLGHIWLVDPAAGETRLVHTAAFTAAYAKDRDPYVSIDALSWSPDGGRLGFLEYGVAFEIAQDPVRAVSLLLPEPGQDGPGRASTLSRSHGVRYGITAVFLWAPDGTRVAVRGPGHVLELSAEDGSILAKHPFIGGPLCWPATRS